MAARPHKQGHGDVIHPVVDTFRLIAETRRQATQVAESARQAIKAFYRDPVQLASFIERHGTPVYVFERRLMTALILRVLGFEPGFIPPSADRRYRLLQQFLTTIHRKKTTLKEHQGEINACHFEHGVFVMTRPLFTVGFLSHQLHHWLAYRSGMAGYCDRAQALYKRFWNERNGIIGQEVYDMSYEDMDALKSAINRDLEALVFLRQVAGEVLIPARQAQRFGTGKAMA
jgi:hypothetical protein